MLREAHSASSDDARLDHGHDHESVPDDARLGAELDGAPPEVRAAAVRRSRRLPEPSIMRAAWASLPLDVRDRIGAMALTHSFYSTTMAEEHRRCLDIQGGQRCEAWSCEALNGIDAVAEAALPELYGTPDAEPLWALADGGAVVFPAETHPSPLTQAIAHHLRSEQELAAVRGLDSEDPVRLAREDAEDRSWHSVIAAPLQTREDLVALYEHFAPEAGEPGEELAARALHALALALQLEVPAKAAPSDPSPIRLAIQSHRRALDELRAAPPWADGNPDEAWLALSDVEHEAFEALLTAPCAHSADAEALVAYLRPLVAEETRHPILHDMGDVTCGVLARVLDVFSAVLKDGAVAAGRLA